MLTLNFRDGTSTKFDPRAEVERKQLNEIGLGNDKKVSGIWYTSDKQRVTLPMPSRFRRVIFYLEMLEKDGIERGWRIILQADETRLTFTEYNTGSTNIELVKTGRQLNIGETR